MTNAAAAKKTTAPRRTRKATATADLVMPLSGPDAGQIVPAKKATAKKSTPAKKVAAKKATAPAEKVLKKEQTFEQRDWTYLDDKEPSEQHELLAREINRRTNLNVECEGCETEVPISAKQVQAVLAMFPHFQRSETNKNRSGYRPLAAEIVHQRSVHMTQAHADARLIMDGLANATGTSKAATAKKATAKPPAKKATPAKPATTKTTPAKKATATRTRKAAAPKATDAF